jgi:hypothetical protein
VFYVKWDLYLTDTNQNQLQPNTFIVYPPYKFNGNPNSSFTDETCGWTPSRYVLILWTWCKEHTRMLYLAMQTTLSAISDVLYLNRAETIFRTSYIPLFKHFAFGGGGKSHLHYLRNFNFVTLRYNFPSNYKLYSHEI